MDDKINSERLPGSALTCLNVMNAIIIEMFDEHLDCKANYHCSNNNHNSDYNYDG